MNIGSRSEQISKTYLKCCLQGEKAEQKLLAIFSEKLFKLCLEIKYLRIKIFKRI